MLDAEESAMQFCIDFGWEERLGPALSFASAGDDEAFQIRPDNKRDTYTMNPRNTDAVSRK